MKKITAVAFVLFLIINNFGCGRKQTADVPELIEPQMYIESTRPVEYMNIGILNVLVSTVKGTEYRNEYPADNTIMEITVKPGDYVEKGDIIAVADTENEKKKLGELQEELEKEKRSYQLRHELEILNEELNENIRYNLVLHQKYVERIQKEIAECETVIEEGTLYASHNGYVTYVKDLNENNIALMKENIVTITDTEDKYLEVEDMKLTEYKYDNYVLKYINFNGEKIPVTEYDYDAATKLHNKPDIRFVCSTMAKMTIGDTYPIYFSSDYVENVPAIGYESLYSQNGEEFVYVKDENGNKEKRIVKTGKKDFSYVQIIEGLAEGEQVYYPSGALIPQNYEELAIEFQTFKTTLETGNYYPDGVFTDRYYSSQMGTIKEIYVKVGEYIEEGMPLFSVDTGEGKAALEEARVRYEEFSAEYLGNINIFDKQIKDTVDEKSRRIIEIEKELYILDNESVLLNLKENYERISSENDGSGVISIKADKSGVLVDLSIKNNDFIESGQLTHAIKSIGGNYLKAICSSNGVRAADFGKKITIHTQEGEFTGTSAGTFTTDEGTKAFYVRMDDENFYDNTPEGTVSYINSYARDCIIIPSYLVHKDESRSYVWKKTGSMIVKQYVTVNEKMELSKNTVILAGLEPGDIVVYEN